MFYFIGCCISFIIALLILSYIIRLEHKVSIGDILMAIVLTLFSWAGLLAIIVAGLVIFIDICNNKIIWKKNDTKSRNKRNDIKG